MSSRTITYICTWYRRIPLETLVEITGLTPKQIRKVYYTAG
jgi:hypothetical protein